MRSVRKWWWSVPLAGAVLLAASAPGDGQAPSEDTARKARIFEDPEIFPQMSGAKRSALELQFGRRPVRGGWTIALSACPLACHFVSPTNSPAQDAATIA